jgi:hypothetical protein
MLLECSMPLTRVGASGRPSRPRRIHLRARCMLHFGISNDVFVTASRNHVVTVCTMSFGSSVSSLAHLVAARSHAARGCGRTRAAHSSPPACRRPLPQGRTPSLGARLRRAGQWVLRASWLPCAVCGGYYAPWRPRRGARRAGRGRGAGWRLRCAALVLWAGLVLRWRWERWRAEIVENLKPSAPGPHALSFGVLYAETDARQASECGTVCPGPAGTRAGRVGRGPVGSSYEPC